MKCPHCNGEHPDGYKFCPVTGKPIELKACANKDCPDFGKRILPAEAKFCPRCGKPILSNTSSEENNVQLNSANVYDEINNLFNLKK